MSDTPAFSPSAATATLIGEKLPPGPATPRVLSIAGTDPSGGAGIQADMKAIEAAGGYSMTVVTALVAQNTLGVRGIHTPPALFLREQLDSVSEDVTVDAVKIGMLGDVSAIDTVRAWLHENRPPVVVLDPVMVSTSGHRLLAKDAEARIREFCRDVDLLTPNLKELAVLTGHREAGSFEEAVGQALPFAREFDVTVIVKGGHLEGPVADNAVVTATGTVHRVHVPRVETPHTHGTGCSLSSALATRLGRGESVEAALEWSSRWLHEAIGAAASLNVGLGNGPVHHAHRSRRLADAASTVPWPQVSPGYVPTVAPPAPRLPAAGPHTEALWNDTGELWAEIMALPFIRGLADGSLREQDFSFYLAQDAAYLQRYARALSHLAATAPDLPGQIAWTRAALGCSVSEKALHDSWLAERGVTGTDSDAGTALSHVTAAYTDFLVATAHLEPYVVGVAAVLPCAWLYAEIGLAVAEHNGPDHPYRAWLDMYGGEKFLAEAAAVIRLAEEALAGANDEERARARRAYLTACAHEREFFDQADRAW